MEPAPRVDIPAEVQPAPCEGASIARPQGVAQPVTASRPVKGGECALEVHWSEVVPVKRAAFGLAPAVLAKGAPAERCKVHLYVDAKGVPYAAEPRSCAAIFGLDAAPGLMSWRFQPWELPGEGARAVAFDLVVSAAHDEMNRRMLLEEADGSAPDRLSSPR
jgi:hypothetical protein